MEALECAADFPALRRRIDGHRIVYLDNAATTLKPRPVIDAVTAFYAENGANIHRGRHYLSEEASDAYERVRNQVAQHMGAFGNEIVFVRNTTEALNLVAHGLGLTRDDLVVGCLDAHHSQILPWRLFAPLKMVRVDSDGRVDLQHFTELLQLRPKVVALTHCSNVTGAIAPIAEMAVAAKETVGATVVVDAAQSFPHMNIDVSRLPVDFLAFSGHKTMSPTGIGCLYGRRQALERLRPFMQGGGMVDWVDEAEARERKIPHRFEAGTPAISGALGLGAALTYREALGESRARTHCEQLTAALLAAVLSRPYLELLGPRSAKDRLAIVTFRIRDCVDLADVARALSDSYGVMCRSGHLCAQPLVDAFTTGEVLRASAYVYNTIADIDLLFHALDEIVELLAR